MEGSANNTPNIDANNGDQQILAELGKMWQATVVEEEINKASATAPSGSAKKTDTEVTFNISQTRIGPNIFILPEECQYPNNLKRIPLEIDLSPQVGIPLQTITVYVLPTALQDPRFQKELSGPVMEAALKLPVDLAVSMLQSHLDNLFGSTDPTKL